MNKIIYISGYGRSGSTILDVMLTTNKEIIGVGELAYFINEYKESCCSCNQNFKDCYFWSDFAPVMSEFIEYERGFRRLESIKMLPFLFFNNIQNNIKHEYIKYNKKLFSYIQNKSGFKYIVDSSKTSRATIGRLILLKKLKYDIYNLHIYKSGLDILYSMLVKGRNRVIEGKSTRNVYAPIVMLSWGITNLLTLIIGHFFFKKKTLIIHYDDLINEPVIIINKIELITGIDLSDLKIKVKREESFSIEHLVGGNRLRFNKEIKLQKPQIKDFSKLSRLSKFWYLLLGSSIDMIMRKYKI